MNAEDKIKHDETNGKTGASFVSKHILKQTYKLFII